MKTIASFKVNHDLLEKGMYISRTDGDIITYDIRMKKPNSNDFLKNGAIHTLEHLFAVYARNTKYEKEIIYVGPMGCRTGFYFLARDKITNKEALKLIQETFKFISDYTGKIPGATRRECGNYLEHDLDGAKESAKDMIKVLENWTEEKMQYGCQS